MPRMMDDGLDALRERGEAFLVELSREYYEAHAGLKGEAQLQPIFAKHAGAFDDEAFAQVQERFRDAPPGGEAHRSARMLLDWLVESRCGRELAALEEREIAWEGSAVIRGNDGAEEPYQRAAITIANTRDKKERQALDDARAKLVAAELAPLKRERLEREHEVVASLGVAGGDGSAARGDYIATWEALSGFRIAPLRDACAQFLRDTQAMWDDVLPEFLKRGLNLTPREATRADAIALMRAPEFDGAFPAVAMEYEVRYAIGQMGASPDAHGRVCSTRAIVPGSARGRSARPCAFPTKCIWCCARTADRTTGRR